MSRKRYHYSWNPKSMKTGLRISGYWLSLRSINIYLVTIYWLQSSCEFILILLCKEIDFQNRSPEVPEGMLRDSKWSSGSRDTPDFGSSVVQKTEPGNKNPGSAVWLEYTGFEPVASTMRMWRAPNCANTPQWKQRGSNPWPPASQASALPAELCFHLFLALCFSEQPAARHAGCCEQHWRKSTRRTPNDSQV